MLVVFRVISLLFLCYRASILDAQDDYEKWCKAMIDQSVYPASPRFLSSLSDIVSVFSHKCNSVTLSNELS